MTPSSGSIELYGPADAGKTATFAALALYLPGVVRKIPIAMFSTSAKRSPEGPNEALAELRGVRLGYGEEPSTGLVLDARDTESAGPRSRPRHSSFDGQACRK